MAAVEQGDLLKVQGIAQPVIVVSNNFFNQSCMAILCPIAQRAIPSPLHIELHDAPVEGYVLCEFVRSVDLSSRSFSKLSSTHYFDVMDISDAVMGIFDYQ